MRQTSHCPRRPLQFQGRCLQRQPQGLPAQIPTSAVLLQTRRKRALHSAHHPVTSTSQLHPSSLQQLYQWRLQRHPSQHPNQWHLSNLRPLHSRQPSSCCPQRARCRNPVRLHHQPRCAIQPVTQKSMQPSRGFVAQHQLPKKSWQRSRKEVSAVWLPSGSMCWLGVSAWQWRL